MSLEIYYLESMEDVRKMIKSCEGEHKQQIVYSSYHDALTQICYTCKAIRTNSEEFVDEVEVEK